MVNLNDMKKYWNKTTQHAINTIATFIVAWAILTATNIVEWFKLPVSNETRIEKCEIADSVMIKAVSERVTNDKFESVIDRLNCDIQEKANNAIIEEKFKGLNQVLETILKVTRENGKHASMMTPEYYTPEYPIGKYFGHGFYHAPAPDSIITNNININN